MTNRQKDFNLVITGVGGQGLITLLKVVAEAALIEGCDVKTSELHGLAQRGGSVEVHIRFGKKIFSPLVSQGKANLVLSLENQEALNGLYFASKNTAFLINKYKTPTFTKDISEEEILRNIKKVSNNVFFVPASETCQKELGAEVVSGIYLLGVAASKKILSLKSDSIVSAIKKTIPEKYLELNIKAFNSALKSN